MNTLMAYSIRYLWHKLFMISYATGISFLPPPFVLLVFFQIPDLTADDIISWIYRNTLFSDTWLDCRWPSLWYFLRTPCSRSLLSATIPRLDDDHHNDNDDTDDGDIIFGFPQIYCWIILGHGVLYFCLFSNFYSKSYMSKAKNRFASNIGAWIPKPEN